jgi:5-hydroxyisourate hydrolase-like protein (transthyretin family)
MPRRTLSRRRAAALSAAAALALSLVTVGVVTAGNHSRSGTFAAATDLGAVCDEVVLSDIPEVPAACAHIDKAPRGVDVNKPVRTKVLEARKGIAARAVRAAQEEGVPVAAQVAAVSDRVPCDGDGTTGYRVQAMYVVTADKANRFAALQDQIKQWAGGVNTVFKLSAAKTGGVREVRYVTASNGDGTCSPTVLNVTVPAGSFTSFNATIAAVQALGFTSTSRKYLMWVDGVGQCGIAQMYPGSKATQDNYNNGYAAQYARIDTACWGRSDHSTEAHELSHMLGSVQGDSPHATAAGHCYDESDLMCYADGGGKAMQQVCALDQEPLFDCNDDDYYSTYPPAGSYLATHWNTADSRFLIGGGNGTGGGAPGVPTALGGTLSVNNPAIPGLPTQVAVNLEVPAGRTTSVAWTSARPDCVFASPTAEQTTVTCDAKSATATKVTATVTDSTGAKLVRTGSLTFSGTNRAVTPTVRIDGSAAASYTSCPSGRGVISAKVLDGASGVGVKGLTVTWYRKVGSNTPTKIGTAATNADGVATMNPVGTAAGLYSAKTTLAPAFAAGASSDIDVNVASAACSTSLTSNVDKTSVTAGSPVTVTGTLTRTLPGGATRAAAGERVAIFTQANGATTWASAGSATTTATGSYSVAIKPTASVAVQARFVARTGFTASTAPSVNVAVVPWTTALTVAPSATDTMAGVPVTLSGTLKQSAGGTTSVMPATPVQVVYPLAGGKTGTASGTTNASGVYSVVIKPTAAGTATVKYAGKPGWTATTATQALTVTTWTSALTMTASRNASTGAVTVTGSLKVTDKAGTTTPKASGVVAVTYQATALKTATVNATTKADGSFAITVRPAASGQVSARYAGGAGYAEATATPVTITVG